MASNSQSGYGTKLKNSEDLTAIIPGLTKYNPIPEDLKSAVYIPFVAGVRTAMTPFNLAEQKFITCQNDTQVIQDSILDVVRKVRAAVFEIHGAGETYDDYNETIDLITGDNVVKNSYKRRVEEEENPPADPNAPVPDFQSVSQQDRGSIYTFFTTLIDALSLDTKYLPNEIELKVVTLKALCTSFGTKLGEYATLEGAFKNQESIIKPMFVGPGSLHDRAERAKAHIKRVYGPNSIEYKSLTGKKY